MKVGDREDREKGTEQKGSVDERSKRKWGNEGRDSNESWCLLLRVLPHVRTKILSHDLQLGNFIGVSRF